MFIINLKYIYELNLIYGYIKIILFQILNYLLFIVNIKTYLEIKK